MKPWLALAAGLVLLFGVPSVGRAPKPKPAPLVADAVVYVYEKSDTAIPAAVAAGLNELNRSRKVTATLFEDDSTDGAGEVPTQYRLPLEAARKAGEPCLVVLSGSTVLKVVPKPETEQAIVEAVR